MNMKVYAKTARTMPLLLISLATTPVIAEPNWQKFARSDSVTVSADVNGITRKNGTAKVWTKWQYSKQQTSVTYPYAAYKSSLGEYQVNCVEGSTSSSQEILYTGDDVTGNAVSSRSFKNWRSDMNDPPPGSIGEAIIAVACGNKLH